MSGYQPPFSTTPSIINRVVEIGELLGRWAAHAEQVSPMLRKENRIRTIQASLAIEHNSLSTEQVSAIMDGKRVLAPARDIQEVRNAILAYEAMSSWKSGRVQNLLAAQRVLMNGLVDAPGQFRTGNVGVYRDKQLIHMAPPANQVSRLMADLLGWLHKTDVHPLIASSIFHYEFEFIHPFADGNGRMGRLWQTLILSEWREELAWLPVETIIHNQQKSYYQVLGECDSASDCTLFIDFMLEKLIEGLSEGIATQQSRTAKMAGEVAVEMAGEINANEYQLLTVLAGKPHATVTELIEMLGRSRRTIERNIKSLQAKGKLQRVGATKKGFWLVI
ncbi:MAG TPA: Fic family protein [Buttiauxella sp.]|uniref:Fic family protein n=1 Tax=Buttiauxella sp. TaxID=1972222 RepID=UPI002B4681E6|nr:Fic family protein [Buttiauxella sp.]HKM98651.1 Fic family protein [Buttiauxella sp.]